MPKISSEAIPLSGLRLLCALSDGSALTASRLPPGVGDPHHLESTGLVERVELELDGLTERAWRITEAGEAALAASGGTAAESIRETERIGSKRTISALVPWFGGARLTGAEVGGLLKGLKLVAVPFCGGLAELPHISAPTILCNDLHRHVINLASVAADPKLGPVLWRRLRRLPFHPDVLKEAQRKAAAWKGTVPDLEAAAAYWVCSWMGRSGRSGTGGELKGALALRWGATGGDSSLRYSSAVSGLRGWRRILARCSFCCMDWKPFLSKFKDQLDHGLYADPPWPETGDNYSHSFTEADHVALAGRLGELKKARVVVRISDCALSRRLYAEQDDWRWLTFRGRNQGNCGVAESLIVKRGEQS